MSKKTAVFCLQSGVGGAERVTLTIAKMLDPKEFDVKIVVIGSSIDDIEPFVPSNMEIHLVQKKVGLKSMMTYKLWRKFREIKPDMAFCSLRYYNPRFIWAAKLAGVKKVIVRNDNSIDNLGFLRMLTVNTSYPFASHIIMQSDEMRTEFLKHSWVNKSKVITILNPVDKQTILKRIEETKDFDLTHDVTNYTFVGRITYVKAVEHLIEAFKGVCDIEPNSRLFIIGKYIEEDKYYKECVELTKRYKIQEKIEWVGFTDNPYKYVKASDCFVLPSRREGLPNVVLEAMYLETPVVCTRSVPVVDRLVSADRGIVIEVGDIEAMTKGMLKMSKLKIKTPYVNETEKEWLTLFN